MTATSSSSPRRKAVVSSKATPPTAKKAANAPKRGELTQVRRTLNTCLALVEMRQREADKNRDAAVAEQRWSQVAGHDGIGTGLLIAAKILRDELQALDVSTAKPKLKRAA